MNQETDSKRIAKNTIMLYIRMIVNMLISLYTARIVLQVLGVEDYGIFGVVGGVLSMFTFLNASMGSATGRFLTYELGRHDEKRLKATFGSAIITHIVIALIITVLAETIGVWFINEKLVVPPERLLAAHYTFQFCIVSMIFTVVGVPYTASVFSHEKMDVYAYVEIGSSLMRLLVVYLLVLGDFDKLILYSFLTASVNILSFFLYMFYCERNFIECKLKDLKWDKGILNQMMRFTGWDMYGNLSGMARNQGVNILLNLFFGPIMNAAADIATRVQQVTYQFSTNVAVASRPQVVKSYSQDNHDGMIVLMRDCSRLTFVLMMLLTVPLILEVHYILNLWLGEVPEHTEVLTVWTLLWNLAVSMNIASNYGVQATGKVKFVSVVSGTLFLSIIPFSYVSFMMGLPYWIPYAYNLFTVVVCPIVAGYTIRQNVRNYSISKILIPDLSRAWISFFITIVVVYPVYYYIEEGFLRLLAVSLISTVLTCLTGFYIVFPPNRREAILGQVKLMINKVRK